MKQLWKDGKRRCGVCKGVFQLVKFRPNKSCPFGFSYYCRPCERGREKKRKASLRTRFKLLKDSNFTCQYCGRTAPAVVLQIDHIHPYSKGGDNHLENLIVACQDCNLGKSDVLLKKAA